MIIKNMNGKRLGVYCCMVLKKQVMWLYAYHRYSWHPVYTARRQLQRQTFFCHLNSVLSSYKSYRKPKPQNIKRLFFELAHQEIIQKQRYIANCWAPVLEVLKGHADFTNVESLRQLFVGNKPSAKTVIKALDVKLQANFKCRKRVLGLSKKVHKIP